MLVESTNMKLKVNRKALAKAVEQWCLCVCHYVVPCHALLCKKKCLLKQKLSFFALYVFTAIYFTEQIFSFFVLCNILFLHFNIMKNPIKNNEEKTMKIQ